MKKSPFLFAFLWSALLAAQADTTIYQVVDEMPRFPGCEELDTTAQVKQQCAQANLLQFIYQNVRYPEAARLNGIEGTVVLRFVVELEGTISQLEVVKDIGGGCAEEALRVVGAMNEVGVRWTPGKKGGQSVRVFQVLPIRFKLEEPLPYTLIGRDSVYTVFDDTLAFEGGHAALEAFIKEKLIYPPFGLDSCQVGDMLVELLVQPNGRLKVINVDDYNNLGFDFQFEAIRASTSTMGKWTPARYQGRAVPTLYDIPVLFAPKDARCATRVKSFLQAKALAEEGAALYNTGKKEEGFDKLSQAIDLFPEHANFRYMRGQAYMNEKEMEKACEDLQIARQVLTLSFLDNLLSIICK
ncbi:MAG: TonB family protein [Saprospirales bacterium]|nr:TonB family protein [Saprospirales bacterium]